MTGEALALPMTHARPVAPAGIDLRCCSVEAMLDDLDAKTGGEWGGAGLVHADPPWVYDNAGTRGNADDQYALLGIPEIVAHLARAGLVAGDGSRLACWVTGPMLVPFVWACRDMGAAWPWEPLGAGAWGKQGQLGVGDHWRGDSEILTLWRRGSPPTLARDLSNLHLSRRDQHSAKPIGWLRHMLRAWTEPGTSGPSGTVLELYAGLGSMARACAAEGRRYVGAEIDAARHADAMGLLAGMVGCRL